ncbi:protein kinase [Streptomyces sp. NPDC005573]|uniref:protein kinase domain-containing protein n=1 Tax=unclassified Streptomyces TaxID=2593676 RepID=UPI0033AA7CAE
MAQTHSAQGPSDPEAAGGGMSDAPEAWGNGGLVGDGRYRLTHRLGRGGMAEVFAAEDVRLGRTVAVKLLRADLAEDPVSKARFTREAQSVAGLNHHAIVAVYDSGEDQVNGHAVPYIVMELVEGRTIRDLLMNAEAPGPEQALIIVSGVLEALAYSHQHGIVHRDIKPANVIITDNGAVKVMDFGIARALHGAQSTMTQTGMVMGTPQYLSPEQALGKAVDHRSDLYATGCLLYELLALRPPFTGETPLSVVYQHVQDMPNPPSSASDGCPPELDGLVMRSLAKEPDDRFQTAEEMRGLIQYGLQMLYDQGGHTGTWNTGPVGGHDGRGPAAGGFAHTTAMQHPGDFGSGTTQIPQQIIPGRYGDDGGFEGHGNRGSGRGKLWILAVLAVVAIAAGVALALNTTGGGGKHQGTDPSTSQSQPAKHHKATKKPSDDGADQPTDTRTDDGSGSGGGTGWSQPYTPTQAPTTADTSEPTDAATTPQTTTEPTDPQTPPTTPADPADGGTDAGTGDGGTGTDAGAVDGGTTVGTTP